MTDYVRTGILKKFLIGITCLGLTFALSGAANPGKSYKTINEFKQAFVNAGGQCWEWKRDPDISGQSGGTCDKLTTLVFYTKKTDTLAQAIEFAKVERSLGFKVHLIVGPNWMVNSDQVKYVHRKLGGTLMTR